jgi:cytoskeleton protein RodZ
MTNENSLLNSVSADSKRIPFGARLKSTREAMGLERKDVATQLRLNEKIIVMMEKDRYPVDLPITFIRGYLRSYAKFLQIPDLEIKKGIEPIKPKSIQNDVMSPPPKPVDAVTSGDYFMQFFTYLIIFTLVALAGMWWFTHPIPLLHPMAMESTKTAKPEKPIAETTPREPSDASAADGTESTEPGTTDPSLETSSDANTDKLSVESEQVPASDEEVDTENNVTQVTPADEEVKPKKPNAQTSALPKIDATANATASTTNKPKPVIPNQSKSANAATTPPLASSSASAKPKAPLKSPTNTSNVVAIKPGNTITTASSIANVLAIEEATAAATLEATEALGRTPFVTKPTIKKRD